MTQSIPATLRATADHLATHGWIKHAFYEPKVVDQRRIVSRGPQHGPDVPGTAEYAFESEAILDYAHAPACSIGALAQVSGAREVIATLTSNGEILFNLKPEVKANPVVAHFEATGAYLRDYLYTQHTDDPHADSVPFWNDHPTRTAAEVIATFRAAADFYEAGNDEVVMRDLVVERRRAIQAERRQRGKRTEAEALAAEGAWKPASVESLVTTKDAMVKLATSVTDVEAYLATINAVLTQMATQAGVDPAVLNGPNWIGYAKDPADIPAGDTSEADAVDALQGAMAIVNAATSPVPA